MKNIEQILAENGITLTDEQKTAINKEVDENYKTVNDWQRQVDKAEALQTTLTETQEKLKVFDGVDAAALNGEIAKLKADLEQKDSEYQAKMADRDFSDMMKGLIVERKGVNEKAIMALLNIDELKASKNQKEDAIKALDALTTAEDSKMLFGESEPKPAGTGNLIGQVQKSGAAQVDTLKGAIAAHYNVK